MTGPGFDLEGFAAVVISRLDRIDAALDPPGTGRPAPTPEPPETFDQLTFAVELLEVLRQIRDELHHMTAEGGEPHEH